MVETTPPIVVELGKKSPKRLKELKNGNGKLMADVQETIAQVRENLGSEAEGKELVPIVVIHKRKRKRSALNPFGT